MAYGSRRTFVYDSDLVKIPWGVQLSELIYEKNPQLGTDSNINPPAGQLYQRLPKSIKPRRAVFASTAAQTRREYIVLSLQSEIWKGNKSTVVVPAQDPEDSNWEIKLIEFTAVSFVGERTSGMLTTGVDTGIDQGDDDSGLQ